MVDGVTAHIGTLVVTTVSANELAGNGGRRIATADVSNANRTPSRNKIVLIITDSSFSRFKIQIIRDWVKDSS